MRLLLLLLPNMLPIVVVMLPAVLQVLQVVVVVVVMTWGVGALSRRRTSENGMRRTS